MGILDRVLPITPTWMLEYINNLRCGQISALHWTPKSQKYHLTSGGSPQRPSKMTQPSFDHLRSYVNGLMPGNSHGSSELECLIYKFHVRLFSWFEDFAALFDLIWNSRGLVDYEVYRFGMMHATRGDWYKPYPWIIPFAGGSCHSSHWGVYRRIESFVHDSCHPLWHS